MAASSCARTSGWELNRDVTTASNDCNGHASSNGKCGTAPGAQNDPSRNIGADGIDERHQQIGLTIAVPIEGLGQVKLFRLRKQPIPIEAVFRLLRKAFARIHPCHEPPRNIAYECIG